MVLAADSFLSVAIWEIESETRSMAEFRTSSVSLGISAGSKTGQSCRPNPFRPVERWCGRRTRASIPFTSPKAFASRPPPKQFSRLKQVKPPAVWSPRGCRKGGATSQVTTYDFEVSKVASISETCRVGCWYKASDTLLLDVLILPFSCGGTLQASEVPPLSNRPKGIKLGFKTDVFDQVASSYLKDQVSNSCVSRSGVVQHQGPRMVPLFGQSLKPICCDQHELSSIDRDLDP